jgi:hypothetical protein
MGDTEENDHKIQSACLVTVLRFETGASRIRSRCADQHTAAFGIVDTGMGDIQLDFETKL